MHAEKTENRGKILLIDGKSDTALFVGLEQEGYEISVCESPQKAWGLVYPIRPDFIIVHLPHPSIKDRVLLQECHALADRVPVIIATAASRIDVFRKELGGGVLRFLPLPLKPNAVRELLHGLESEWMYQF